MIESCLYTRYFSLDPQIRVGSVLYVNDTSPLTPVFEGFYSINLGTPEVLIYKVNDRGEVTDILSESDTECKNDLNISYSYYVANKFLCLECSNGEALGDPQTVNVKVDSTQTLTLGNFYLKQGVIDPRDPEFSVYEITDGPFRSSDEVVTIIINNNTRSESCSSPCSGVEIVD